MPLILYTTLPSYAHPFQKMFVTESEQRFVDFHDLLHTIPSLDSVVLSNIGKLSGFLDIGRWKDGEQYLDIVSDFNNLYTYLELIQIEREEEAALDTCNIDSGSAFYVDKYNLKCIKDYFKCKGIDISNILDLYDLPISTSTTTNGLGGIGSMAIEELEDTECPGEIFIVS